MRSATATAVSHRSPRSGSAKRTPTKNTIRSAHPAANQNTKPPAEVSRLIKKGRQGLQNLLAASVSTHWQRRRICLLIIPTAPGSPTTGESAPFVASVPRRPGQASPSRLPAHRSGSNRAVLADARAGPDSPDATTIAASASSPTSRTASPAMTLSSRRQATSSRSSRVNG